MKLLFVHQNFPGQFRHLATTLAANPANQVVALHINATPPIRGVATARYAPERPNTPGIHPLAIDFESKVVRGQAAFNAARALRARGFTPDVIVAHPGWGESLFLTQVWPQARLGLYCEYFYGNGDGNSDDSDDSRFDPEFAMATPELAELDRCRVMAKNAGLLLALQSAHGGLSPTGWQRAQFPEWVQPRISVVHDGIDTDRVAPAPQARLLVQGRELSRNDELITFVNRNLEPYRGYHIFMRALPQILRERPHATVLIVGGDGVSYGRAPGNGKTWKQIFLDEVRDRIDLSRVHFLGQLPHDQFVRLLQVSRVHVYLTYPFVLGWSLLEAMSAGCAIVASDTSPVREVITDDVTGRMAPFHDPAQIAAQVRALLDDGAARERLGRAARQWIVERYDLKRVCLPGQLKWVADLAR